MLQRIIFKIKWPNTWKVFVTVSGTQEVSHEWQPAPFSLRFGTGVGGSNRQMLFLFAVHTLRWLTVLSSSPIPRDSGGLKFTVSSTLGVCSL